MVFSVIADEARDCSNKEKMFILKKVIQESFFLWHSLNMNRELQENKINGYVNSRYMSQIRFRF